jgi:Ca2+-binding RTX toxin-like protein
MYAAGKGADTMNYSSSTTTNWISGDQGNDTITGGTVNDYIIGGVGSDTISTGTGTDTVIYYNPNEGGDTIATGGFTAASDKLAFLSSNFGGITSLTLNTNFFTGAPPSISGTSPLFFYNTTTGVLTYDSNGVSAGGDTVIATFAGTPPILGVTNFQFFS